LAKQLEYPFRLTAMGRYEDFRWVTYYEHHHVPLILSPAPAPGR